MGEKTLNKNGYKIKTGTNYKTKHKRGNTKGKYQTEAQTLLSEANTRSDQSPCQSRPRATHENMEHKDKGKLAMMAVVVVVIVNVG